MDGSIHGAYRCAAEPQSNHALAFRREQSRFQHAGGAPVMFFFAVSIFSRGMRISSGGQVSEEEHESLSARSLTGSVRN